MRVGFRTTIDDKLLSEIKMIAIQEKVNVNDILEQLIKKYLNGEIILSFNKQ